MGKITRRSPFFVGLVYGTILAVLLWAAAAALVYWFFSKT
jgi:hypothetical protein